jgi:hypothetical protein
MGLYVLRSAARSCSEYNVCKFFFVGSSDTASSPRSSFSFIEILRVALKRGRNGIKLTEIHTRSRGSVDRRTETRTSILSRSLQSGWVSCGSLQLVDGREIEVCCATTMAFCFDRCLSVCSSNTLHTINTTNGMTLQIVHWKQSRFLVTRHTVQ